MRLLVMSALTAYLALAGAAMAASDHVSGTITDIDSGKHQVVLSDGQTYAIPANIKADGLQKGDRVTMVSDKQDGANVVQTIARN